jgi:hypothetical protein
MKRFAIVLLAALLVVAPASAQPASATQGETDVTGAGDGVFPSGAALAGVSLSGSQFGIGVIVYADGFALGEFQSLLLGTSLLGTPQNISVDGKVSTGVVNAGGSVTFAGTCTLDMGDGTLPSFGVPFSVTLTSGGAMTLAIGATTLPTQTLSAGSVTIE